MHLLKAGESIEDKVQRNVAVLEPLANALHDVHSRADSLSSAIAWDFARPNKLQQKFIRNLNVFERAVSEFKVLAPELAWEVLWPKSCDEQLATLSETIFNDEDYVGAFGRAKSQAI